MSAASATASGSAPNPAVFGQQSLHAPSSKSAAAAGAAAAAKSTMQKAAPASADEHKWVVATTKGSPSPVSGAASPHKAPAPATAAHLTLRVDSPAAIDIAAKKAEFLAIRKFDDRTLWIRDNTAAFFEIIRTTPDQDKFAYINCLPIDLFNLWAYHNEKEFHRIIDRTLIDSSVVASDPEHALTMCEDMERFGACLYPNVCKSARSYFEHYKVHVTCNPSFRTRLCVNLTNCPYRTCSDVHIGDIAREVVTKRLNPYTTVTVFKRFLGIQTAHGPLLASKPATANPSPSAGAASPKPPATPPKRTCTVTYTSYTMSAGSSLSRPGSASPATRMLTPSPAAGSAAAPQPPKTPDTAPFITGSPQPGASDAPPRTPDNLIRRLSASAAGAPASSQGTSGSNTPQPPASPAKEASDQSKPDA
jgi:hypothetical protein